MSKHAEQQLQAAAERSHRAKRLLRQQIAGLRQDLAERPLPARIASQAAQEAQEIAGDALELAKENRGKIALGLVAAAGWLLRAPLLRFGQQLGEEASRNLRGKLAEMRDTRATKDAESSVKEPDNG